MELGNQHGRVAVLTCTPMAMEMGPEGKPVYQPLDPRWHRARMGLSFGTNINVSEMVCDGCEVGDARSKVAAYARGMKVKPWSIFFLDSDVIPSQDAFIKLFYHLKTKPWIDIACGIYVVKGAAPYDPLIYQGNGFGAFWDFAVGDILTTKSHDITACHMGLTLIRTSIFDRLVEAGVVHGDGTDQDDCPFFKTENYRIDAPAGAQKYQGTEDIFFCNLGSKLDPPLQILVDTSVLSGHVDRKTGQVYGLTGDSTPIERAKWLPLPDGSGRRKDQKEAEDYTEICICVKSYEELNGHPGRLVLLPDKKGYPQQWASFDCTDCKGTGKVKRPLKLAIDLGAGESHREWAGYRTYRLDSRRDSSPDYCQELEKLNLPDDHYDLVASRHSFEHVGRFQQEQLWSEAYRICKPGGRLEVIVPSLLWAAQKIVAGELDIHVFNVVFGGAESDQEMKESGGVYNIHKFGYTPDVLRALAESAGFTEVKITDWRDDPGMNYHMVLHAVKPLVKKEELNESREITGAADPVPEGPNVQQSPIEATGAQIEANGVGADSGGVSGGVNASLPRVDTPSAEGKGATEGAQVVAQS